MNDIFETVKSSVTVPEVAAQYGINVSKGKAICPFHDDCHPSLYLHKTFFHCFACGAGGDQVALVSKLFGLPPLDAAKKICDDFGIQYSGQKKTIYEIAEKRKDIRKREALTAWEGATFAELAQIYRGICKTMQEHIGLYETIDLRKAIQLYSRVQYFVSVLTFGNQEEKKDLYLKHREEIDSIVRTAYSKDD